MLVQHEELSRIQIYRRKLSINTKYLAFLFPFKLGNEISPIQQLFLILLVLRFLENLNPETSTYIAITRIGGNLKRIVTKNDHFVRYFKMEYTRNIYTTILKFHGYPPHWFVSEKSCIKRYNIQRQQPEIDLTLSWILSTTAMLRTYSITTSEDNCWLKLKKQ